MPPQLALALCTSFVVVLLWLERRGSRDVSTASWIPTVWMLAIASKPLGIWFGNSGENESGSLPDRVLLMGLAVAGMMVVVVRGCDWSGALKSTKWLLVLLAYMFVSTVWSDITAIALRRWLRELIIVVMALVVMSEHDPRQTLESLLRRSAYILIPFSLILIKYYPGLGVSYGRWSGDRAWIGVTLQKNALGRLCIISAIFVLWALLRRWRGRGAPGCGCPAWSDVSVLVIALFLLKGEEGAYSATSIGTLAVGTASLLGLLWSRKLQIRVPQAGLLALATFLIVFGASAPFYGGSNLAVFSSTFGREETLTGRTTTWAELVPVVKRQPLLGHGFGSFWTTARREQYDMSHGHNGYLDTLLELGVLGLALYIAWLLSCVRKLHRSLSNHYDLASLAIAFLMMALLYNATESALNGLTHQMTAVLALAVLVVPYEPVRASRRSHLSLRLHVPSQRAAASAAVQSCLPENRRAVRLLNGGGR